MKRNDKDVAEHRNVRVGGQYVLRDPKSNIFLVGDYGNIRGKSIVPVDTDSLDRSRTYDARVYEEREGALQLATSREDNSYAELSLEAIKGITIQPKQKLVICESARSKRIRATEERISRLKKELENKLLVGADD